MVMGFDFYQAWIRTNPSLVPTAAVMHSEGRDKVRTPQEKATKTSKNGGKGPGTELLR